MGGKTKSWSKAAKGGLATVLGSWTGIAVPVTILGLKNLLPKNAIFFLTGLPAFLPAFLSIKGLENMSEIYASNLTIQQSILAINILACLGAAYKGLTYGPKTFKAGLNYKEYLQNMLANLDAIDAHITQVNA